jgi:hypothetical protein
MNPESIKTDLMQHPEKYAYWFSVCFKNVMEYLDKKN